MCFFKNGWNYPSLIPFHFRRGELRVCDRAGVLPCHSLLCPLRLGWTVPTDGVVSVGRWRSVHGPKDHHPPLTRLWAPLSGGGVQCTGPRTATPTHSSVGTSVGRWRSVHGTKDWRGRLCRTVAFGARAQGPPPPLTRPWAPLSGGDVRCMGPRTGVGASVGRWRSVHGPKDRHPHSLVRGRLCRAVAFGARGQGLTWAPLSGGDVRCTGPKTATLTHSFVGVSVGRRRSLHGPKGYHPTH
jgi:hypothetical protein